MPQRWGDKLSSATEESDVEGEAAVKAGIEEDHRTDDVGIEEFGGWSWWMLWGGGRFVDCREELGILAEMVEGLDPKTEDAILANLQRAIKLIIKSSDHGTVTW